MLIILNQLITLFAYSLFWFALKMSVLIIDHVDIMEVVTYLQERSCLIYWKHLSSILYKAPSMVTRKKESTISLHINLKIIDRWDILFLQPLLKLQRKETIINLRISSRLKSYLWATSSFGISWKTKIRLNLLVVTRIQEQMNFPSKSLKLFYLANLKNQQDIRKKEWLQSLSR